MNSVTYSLKSRRVWLALVAGILLMILAMTPALAQDVTPSDDEVNAIAKGMYCPVCENVPLDVCPTQACVQWREVIRDKLAEGWTEDQIKDYFVLQYGDRVLAEPPPRGLNWVVYLAPPLILLGGVFILYRAFRSWKTPAQNPAEEVIEAAPPEDEYIRRLEDELRKR